MTEQKLLAELQSLPAMRTAVENLDNALSQLTPEERMLAELMIIHPRRNNVQKLCQMLHVEYSTVYRRRKALLKKLQRILTGIHN